MVFSRNRLIWRVLSSQCALVFLSLCRGVCGCMKKRAMKSAIIAIEVVAIAIAISAAVLVFLYWRLGQGPVSLGLMKSGVERVAETRLPDGFDASIGAIELVRAPARGEYRLTLSTIEILDADDELAASAPEVTFTFGAGDFLGGGAAPRTVTADGALLRIVRRRNQNIELPVAATPKENKPRFSISSLLERRVNNTAFRSVDISNAEITFLDEASGRSWTAPSAQVVVERNDDGLIARAHGEIDTGGGPAGIDANATYTAQEGLVNVVVDGDNFPVGDLLGTFYSAGSAILDAPVSGKARITFTPDGDVVSSSFSASAREGFLVLGGSRRAISSIVWTTDFDPNQNVFDVKEFAFDVEGAEGLVTGEVGISFGDDIRKPERVSFDLRAAEILVDLPDLFPEILPVTDVALAGQYVLPERRLTMQTLDAQSAGLKAAGDLSFVMARAEDGARAPSPGVIANIAFEGALDPQRLLMIWPKPLALGARDWIEARLETATIENLNFAMDMAPGAIAEDGAVPDDAMTFTFDARNVGAYYVPGMTMLSEGAGSGVLRGNSFHLDVKKARINDIAITRGEVSFPTFMPKWEPTYYRFTAVGEADAMLSILDEKPLGFLSKVNLRPDQFSGDATAEVEIMRPNKRYVASEEYGYDGKATFENMTIADLIGDVQFLNAKGAVDLKTRSLKVTADAALIDDAPINLIWRQNFYREDGPSDIAISGVFDAATGDLFGISSRQFVRGPVAFDAKAIGDLGAFERLNVKTDFTNAALSVDLLGWRKPAGTPASGDVVMHFEDGAVVVDTLAMTGGGVDIAGALSLNASGALQSAAMPLFYLEDAADLIITAERDATGMLGFTAVGEFLNVGSLIEQLLDAPGDVAPAQNDGDTGGGAIDWGQGITLNARIDRLAMRGGVEYRNAALDLARNADQMQMLDFSAFGEDNKPLTVTMALTGAEDGPQHAIEARTSGIGDLMAGLFDVKSVRGGEGSMRLMQHEEGVGGFSGQLEARNLQLVNAPLLARILSAGSLGGIANLLNGDGIAFDYAFGEFDYGGGQLSVKGMRATGSSVGITAEGDVGFGPSAHTSLNGAVAPIYGLNSMLGNAPLIGDLLVGKKGEGLVAFSYRVNGDLANPSVFVNPLSVLTPGILRGLMAPASENDETPPAVTEEPTDPAARHAE